MTLGSLELAYIGAGLLLLGGAIAVGLVVANPHSMPARAWERYVASLETHIRFLFLSTPGRTIARGQLGSVAAAAILAFLLRDARILWLIPLAIVAPRIYLRYARSKRVERIEEQLDGWLLMLANMLKATGALGDGIASSADLVRAPISQELDLVLKEVRLGRPLDDALEEMAIRVGSPTVSAVVTMLLVGRDTGGELPSLMEKTAQSLREMARLDGVVRTKTAQGKAQLLVLVLAPLVIVGGFIKIEPTFFDPLYESFIGYLVLGGAVVLWMMSLFTARKILDVDY